MPRIIKITDHGSMGGQRAFVVKIRHPSDVIPSRVEFVGPSGNMVGPVVMITDKGRQVSVSDPGRFGPFNREWIKRFFA